MATKTVGVVLSGCGVYDGSEIHEAVLTLLYLSQAGAEASIFAVDKPQLHVVNHLTGDVTSETRNVLVESARIARGKVADIRSADPEKLDALVFPGGFGAAKNLSDWALKGPRGAVDPGVADLIRRMHAAKKPIGFICIAPASIGALAFPSGGLRLTIGGDKETSAAIEETGNHAESTAVNEITIDEKHNIVSTSAYMCAANIAEAAKGIEKLVAEVLRRTR